jgi:hypothetical protein
MAIRRSQAHQFGDRRPQPQRLPGLGQRAQAPTPQRLPGLTGSERRPLW